MTNLADNAAWTFLGHATFALCHWAGLIVIARLGGPAEVGIYALAMAVVMPAMLFGGLQMREIQVADVIGRYGFSDYMATRLVGTAAVAAGLLILGPVLYDETTAPVIIMVTMILGIDNLSEVYYGAAQRRYRFDVVANSRMIRGLLGLLVLGIVYKQTKDLGIALFCVAITRLLVLGAFDAVWMSAYRRDAPDTPVLPRRLHLVWEALPLGIAILLATLNPNIPRYFLEASGGAATLGIFAAMAHIVVGGRIAITALSQAAAPRMADLYADGDRSALARLLVRLVTASALPGVLGMVLVIAIGRQLLVLIYGPDFAAGAEVFPWIMLVGVVLFAQTPLGYALTATQQFQVQPPVFAAVVLVNAVACLLLVPWNALLGSTLGWLAAVSLQFGLSILVLAHTMRNRA